MYAFTGCWQLNHSKSSKQSDLLTAMERPRWQIRVGDGADERIRLLHCTKTLTSDKQLHFFDKKVKIYLNSSLLNILSKLTFNKIPFNEVNYHHNIYCDKEQTHQDDSKNFGQCTSRTTWNNEEKSFTIRWYIKNGLLKVVHTNPSKNEFKCCITFTNKKGQVTKAEKVYDRIQMLSEDNVYMQNIEHSNLINH